MVVKLPNGRAVVVDAKASTAAFLEARTASDEAAAKDALGRHAKALRKQVDALAKKNYGASVANAVDFVVMFVPGAQFLSDADESRLQIEAVEKPCARLQVHNGGNGVVLRAAGRPHRRRLETPGNGCWLSLSRNHLIPLTVELKLSHYPEARPVELTTRSCSLIL